MPVCTAEPVLVDSSLGTASNFSAAPLSCSWAVSVLAGVGKGLLVAGVGKGLLVAGVGKGLLVAGVGKGLLVAGVGKGLLVLPDIVLVSSDVMRISGGGWSVRIGAVSMATSAITEGWEAGIKRGRM